MRSLCLLAASATALFAQLAPPNDSGISFAFLTDTTGTRIELTQGLAAK